MKLIIVESPTKVKSFSKIFKNKEITVFATKGHIRDLPKNKLAIDIENNFKPEYVDIKEKKQVIKELKSLGKKADEIILATDPDREGESISYHTAYYLGFIKEDWPDFKIINNKTKLKRMVFYEITETELKKAFENAKELRSDLVKAQNCRRILDRLVGYKVSPLLWKKIGKRWLSAGRVQTVALRLVVERQKEIDNFKPETYFNISAEFRSDKQKFLAQLKQIKGEDIDIRTTLSLFAGDYTYKKTKLNESNIEEEINRLEHNDYKIKKIETKKTKRQAPSPLNTSLLQQLCNRNFGYSTKYTMRIAQSLYEQGLITYHRTDSFNLSEEFLKQAKTFILKEFGKDYLNEQTKTYKTKSRLAQEAHEAIRPTDLNKKPEILKNLSQPQKKVYKLIYKRALATQFKPAEFEILKIHITNKDNDLFVTEQERLVFDGYLKLYPNLNPRQDKFLKLTENSKLDLEKLNKEEKQTLPPPAYTEAGLIKALEEKGIGRPSTYAPIISLIQERKYVEKIDGVLRPSILGTAISDYLSNSFKDIFELDFTAKMEEDLDKIANGEEDIIQVIYKFYKPLEKDLEKNKNDQTHINVERETEKKCPKCGKNLILRFSKYGKFYGCSGFPDCKYIEPYIEYVDNVACPKCGGKIIIKKTSKGKRFYGCKNYPDCDFSSWKLPKQENNNT
ncbi:MAG: DNA topoisomerase 1 [Patescibacteria group bacterium]|nr:MAG: DNA topoisomerase 1 [Patescibacteria group bacterium]